MKGTFDMSLESIVFLREGCCLGVSRRCASLENTHGHRLTTRHVFLPPRPLVVWGLSEDRGAAFHKVSRLVFAEAEGERESLCTLGFRLPLP